MEWTCVIQLHIDAPFTHLFKYKYVVYTCTKKAIQNSFREMSLSIFIIIKCYKNALCLNSDTFRTINTIESLFSIHFTTGKYILGPSTSSLLMPRGPIPHGFNKSTSSGTCRSVQIASNSECELICIVCYRDTAV